MTDKVTNLNKNRAQRRQASAAAVKEANEAAVASALSPEDAAAAFGAAVPSFNAADFKGALLTNDRLIIYTKAEHRTGMKIPYVMFFRGPMLVGIFEESAVLEEGIEGVIVDVPQPQGQNPQG